MTGFLRNLGGAMFHIGVMILLQLMVTMKILKVGEEKTLI